MGPPRAGSAQQDHRQTSGLSVSARRRANGFAQSLFLWVLRRVLGDFVAYGGGGGRRGCGCTPPATHVKNGRAALRYGMGAEECLLSRRRPAVIVPSKAR